MTHDEEERARALRELASLVLRDGVDSDHLDTYMEELLSARLLELPAVCRLEATVVTRCFAGLPAREVASHLNEKARCLEHTVLPLRISPPAPIRRQASFVSGDQSEDCAGRDRRLEVPVFTRRCSALPELIASIVFAILGAVIILDWPPLVPSQAMIASDDERLQFITAATCAITVVLYACEGIRLAWRDAHRRKGPGAEPRLPRR